MRFPACLGLCGCIIDNLFFFALTSLYHAFLLFLFFLVSSFVLLIFFSKRSIRFCICCLFHSNTSLTELTISIASRAATFLNLADNQVSGISTIGLRSSAFVVGLIIK